jgi:hypothetical protein
MTTLNRPDLGRQRRNGYVTQSPSEALRTVRDAFLSCPG